MTVETVAMPMLADEARRLTERIRHTAISVREGVERLQALVAEAQAGQAHVALGYPSWTAYLADVMGDEPMRLARDERREVVAWLAGEGMSTRAIAPIVGQSHMTVARDLSGVTDVTPAPAPSAPTPEETVAVTGLDGKTYQRTAPATHFGKSLPIARSVVTVAYWKFAALSREDAEEFFSSIAEMRTEGKGDPRLALSRRLAQATQAGVRLSQVEQYTYVVQAWNAWRSGAARTRVQKLGPSTSIPKPL